MVNPSNGGRATESRRRTWNRNCGECGRATFDGLARYRHCGYSAAAIDRLGTAMAAAFLVLAVIARGR